jgi:hypothetical protein
VKKQNPRSCGPEFYSITAFRNGIGRINYPRLAKTFCELANFKGSLKKVFEECVHRHHDECFMNPSEITELARCLFLGKEFKEDRARLARDGCLDHSTEELEQLKKLLAVRVCADHGAIANLLGVL